MVKASHNESMALRKGAWTPEEDQKLSAYIKRYGIWNWSHMPRPAGLARSGKSCRLRWMNYLRPGIKRGNFSKEDEETVVKWHQVLGNRWSVIAAKLPGRTDSEIKNYWHTHLKRRCNRNSQSTSSVSHSVKSSGCVEANKNDYPDHQIQDLPLCDAQVSNLPDSRGTSPQLFPDYLSSSSNGCAVEIDHRNQTEEETCSPSETFEELQSWWQQPFSLEDMCMMETDSSNLIMSPVSTAVWLQQTIYPYTSFEDAGAGIIDLWG